MEIIYKRVKQKKKKDREEQRGYLNYNEIVRPKLFYGRLS